MRYVLQDFQGTLNGPIQLTCHYNTKSKPCLIEISGTPNDPKSYLQRTISYTNLMHILGALTNFNYISESPR